MSKDYPWGKGTPTWERDATANDSDKSFTVPTGKIRVYDYVGATIVASADVGNRALGVSIMDGATLLYHSQLTGNIAASANGSIIVSPEFSSPNTTPIVGLTGALGTIALREYIPRFKLTAGQSLRVRDVNIVAVAADDMTVEMHYVEYDA